MHSNSRRLNHIHQRVHGTPHQPLPPTRASASYPSSALSFLHLTHRRIPQVRASVRPCVRASHYFRSCCRVAVPLDEIATTTPPHHHTDGGSSAARQHGSTAARQHGSTAARQHGSTAGMQPTTNATTLQRTTNATNNEGKQQRRQTTTQQHNNTKRSQRLLQATACMENGVKLK